ncbi:hypothetical protein LMG29542_07752 [Paraburkholderia humisilvae]|uniref:Proteolipid membrane potential modulator n=2 Tax=Paraburkholderia humisilvae TaxID=627669 RepID=A0A6J5FAW6_9BURK|nr:hypothetical protein LMG29542_07752 [Paraburkholderia humisilvae]
MLRYGCEPDACAVFSTRFSATRVGWQYMNIHYTRICMRLLLALIVPWLQFFTIGRPLSGIVCLLLQVTVIGWIPAALWSVYALSQYKTDKKIQLALVKRN